MLNAVSSHPQRVISVLSVSPIEEDHRSLERIFSHTNWKLHKAPGLRSVAAFLRDEPVSVVLCERDLRPGTWKDMLGELSGLTVPQPLVVTTRLADDALWGEVLNLGGHDVLAKPFDFSEVVRVVSLAWWHWNRRCTLLAKPPARAVLPIWQPRTAKVGAA
jgi:DNA-binding response OmpR family regulator